MIRPEHGKYRALINPLLAPQKMAALEGNVRRYARQYIDRFKDRGHCDYMSEFAFEFPIAVFLDLMGLPQSDVKQLLAWETKLLHEPDLAEIAGAVRGVKGYLQGKMAERRKNPGDDFISFAVQAEVDGRPLNEDELIGLTFGLYIGGLDTVSTNMGLHFRHLGRGSGTTGVAARASGKDSARHGGIAAGLRRRHHLPHVREGDRGGRHPYHAGRQGRDVHHPSRPRRSKI